MRFSAPSSLLIVALLGQAASAQPTVAYEVRVDPARADAIEVTIHVRNAPPRVRLAMKVHPEYDARFWQYLEFAGGDVVRLDSTLWEAALAGGSGDLRYTLHLPAEPDGPRRAWRTTVRANGALLNPPDVFLYLPDLAESATSITIDAPSAWRVATSLRSARSPRELRAPNAATMLDAPIMLGALRQWSFDESGTRFVVAYWPLPNATPFDSNALASGLRRLAHAALGVFGSTPSPSYWFLLQDGANDALEHRASVTIGLPSADLARNPRAHAAELAHEFFHAWNLVAIHPDGYGDLTYGPTPPTATLWWFEGVTLHYADVLLRRAGLADSADSRAVHLENLLSRYLFVPWSRTVSPEAASLAFRHSVLVDPNATSGYYLQGELLGEALDAAIRDSTRERRTLDDVMRALHARSRSGGGLTARDLVTVTDSVCACRLDTFFATQVHEPGFIDLRPALARLGWRMAVDTVRADDARGTPLADLRLNGAASGDSALALVVTYPSSAWARAGLRTGDVLESFNGTRPVSLGALFASLRRLRIGDTAVVVVRRGGTVMRFEVVLPGYDRPRVRLVDAERVTGEQRTRRARWLAGW